MSAKRDLRKALAAASASLLAVNATTHTVHAKDSWDIDTELLYYQEADDRVQDASFKSLATRPINDDDQLTISLQFDSLSGASPNGAAIQGEVQTFTQASGNGAYSTQANELPLDNTFQDSRVALTGSYQQTRDSGARFTNGVSFSKEYDYLHLGANSAYAFDFDNNNRTLSIGLGLASDTIEAVGGTPVANAFIGSEGANAIGNRSTSESKTVLDFLVGFTQIINRRSLVQLNYSASVFDGYLNDPYKFVSVLDDSGELAESGDGSAGLYRYENRPNSRTGHNVYLEYKYRFDQSIANLAYRYHTDDWGVDSHTVEARYRWLIDAKQWLEPNIRYYSQSAADFYAPWVFDSSLPGLSSADYRLNEFTGVTIGLAYNRKLGKDNAIGFSLESYQTTGADTSTETPEGGVVTAKSTDLSATIFRLNYNFKW